MILIALPLSYLNTCCAEIIDPGPTKVSCDGHRLSGVWLEDDMLLCSTTPEEGRLLGWWSFMAKGSMESHY